MKHHAIVVEQEKSKNKTNSMRRVNHGDLYVSFESQPDDFKEKNHLPKKLHPSPWWESANPKSLVVGAWEHIILY
ncbi:hypothetical protein A2U01_0077057, partial [Trifolium medium]|nr:hypothetical protein [Trifolium medium]